MKNFSISCFAVHLKDKTVVARIFVANRCHRARAIKHTYFVCLAKTDRRTTVRENRRQGRRLQHLCRAVDTRRCAVYNVQVGICWIITILHPYECLNVYNTYRVLTFTEKCELYTIYIVCLRSLMRDDQREMSIAIDLSSKSVRLSDRLQIHVRVRIRTVLIVCIDSRLPHVLSKPYDKRYIDHIRIYTQLNVQIEFTCVPTNMIPNDDCNCCLHF